MQTSFRLKYFAQALAHFAFPQLCLSCHQPLLQEEIGLCIGCAGRLSVIKPVDTSAFEGEVAARLAGRFPFEQAFSHFYFPKKGVLQDLLYAVKYDHYKKPASFLGEEMANVLGQYTWVKTIDFIIPVPLHHSKLKKRGYNQSVLFAAPMAQKFQIPLREDLLIRTRNTATQTHKSRIERLSNLDSAFLLLDLSVLKGKHVLLFDDVLTTGATLESCALAILKLVPDVRISVATLALAI